MIRFLDVDKQVTAGKKKRLILNGVNAAFMPGVAHGVLARPGQGKTTLIQLISGGLRPDHGHIDVAPGATVSYPLGYAGWLANDLSGAENIAFMARLYGRNVDDLIAEVFDFMEFNPQNDGALRNTTPILRTKLAYGVCFALNFDYQLVDEAIGTGDAAFRAKCFERLLEKRNRSGVIAACSNWTILARFCDVCCVLHEGRLEFFSSVTAARDHLNLIAPL